MADPRSPSNTSPERRRPPQDQIRNPIISTKAAISINIPLGLAQVRLAQERRIRQDQGLRRTEPVQEADLLQV